MIQRPWSRPAARQTPPRTANLPRRTTIAERLKRREVVKPSRTKTLRRNHRPLTPTCCGKSAMTLAG
jgi:hypothetical protein